MRARNVVATVAMLVALAACKTTGSTAPAMGGFFSDGGETAVIPFDEGLGERLGAPDEPIVIIYNHGTDWGGKFQDCKPGYMPRYLKTWARTGLGDHRVVVFYLCTQVVEDWFAMGKARAVENEAVLDRLIAAGVPRDHIFVFGHSGGASTALMTAERAGDRFNSAVVSAPGYGLAWLEAEGEDHYWLDVEYDKWRSRLAGAEDMSALVFLYEGDIYAPPGQAAFLADHPGVEVVTIRDENGDGQLCAGEDEPHFYWWTPCFRRNDVATVEDFVLSRLAHRERLP